MTAITATVLSVLSDIYSWYGYSSLSPDASIDDGVLPFELIAGIVGLLQIVAVLAAFVTFLRWVYRTSRNLRGLSGDRMEFTPGWSVAWFFVPVANLFKPYQVLKDLWRVSHRESGTPPVILGMWWSLWLVSCVLGFLVAKVSLNAVTVSDCAASAAFFAVYDTVEIAVRVAALIVVTRIGEAYLANIGEPPTAPPESPQTSPVAQNL